MKKIEPVAIWAMILSVIAIVSSGLIWYVGSQEEEVDLSELTSRDNAIANRVTDLEDNQITMDMVELEARNQARAEFKKQMRLIFDEVQDVVDDLDFDDVDDLQDDIEDCARDIEDNVDDGDYDFNDEEAIEDFMDCLQRL